MAYVYRFISRGEIIYVGYTGQTMEQRMSQHFGGKGHLSQECYKTVEVIEYMPLKTKSDAIIFETYLINKYKPKFNKQSKKNDAITLNIDIEEKWKLYKVVRRLNVAPTKPMSIWKSFLLRAGMGIIFLLILLLMIVNMIV